MTSIAIASRSALSKGTSMKRLISTLLTAAAIAAPIALLSDGAASAQSTVTRPSQEIAVSTGRGQLITIPGRMADVFIADDKIADVQIKSPTQLYLMGKAGGTTTIYASNSAGQIIWSSTIKVGSNIDSLDSMLRLAMPDAKVTASTINANTVLLTGTVAAPEDAAEAKRLVEAFIGKDANIISRLKTATPLQVNLQVKFAEVSRSLVRTIGANLITKDSSGGFLFGAGTGRGAAALTLPIAAKPAVGATPAVAAQPGAFVQLSGATTFAGMTKFLGMDVGAAFDLAERDGLITTLANPNLTALSGETADFLAGGEYPIPISQGLGSTSIEYKRFGVSLSYTPTVLANGRISLRVRPEVSELSSEGAVTLNGFQVPSLTIRRAETSIELGSGQSFMIAGLLSNNAQTTIDKAPGVGDMPILGNLFRSNSFRKGQTELVIIVTPYLVNPVNASDIKLPTDGFQAPNVGQQFFMNQLTDGKTGGDRPKPTTAPDANVAPKVGDADEQKAPDGKSKPSTADASTGAAKPGFSLN
jgi:pilus assembly protein CpaC